MLAEGAGDLKCKAEEEDARCRAMLAIGPTLSLSEDPQCLLRGFTVFSVAPKRAPQLKGSCIPMKNPWVDVFSAGRNFEILVTSRNSPDPRSSQARSLS